MTRPAPMLEYRRWLPRSIRRSELSNGSVFYVPPLRIWRDSVFWICFVLASALSTLAFSDPLLDAFRYQESDLFVLLLLVVCSWGLCGWLSAKASITMNPHWRLVVSPPRLSFRARAAWKGAEGTWDRSELSRIVLEEAGEEGRRYVKVSIVLQGGEELGLVMADPAHAPEMREMAAAVSQLLNVPISSPCDRQPLSPDSPTVSERPPM